MKKVVNDRGFRTSTAIVVLWVGFAAFYVYFWDVVQPGAKDAAQLQAAILSRSAVSPFAYRVLAPLVIEALRIALAAVFPERHAFTLAYGMFCLAAIECSVMLLYVLFRTWYSELLSIVGVLVVALTIAVGARNHYFQPWSLLEIGFYAAAVIAGVKSLPGTAAVVTILASLNRETGIAVPLLYFAVSQGASCSRKRLLGLAVHLTLWASVFAGLRLFVGVRAHPEGIGFNLHENLRFPSVLLTVAALSALFGAVLPFGLWGIRKAVHPLRRAAVVVVPLYAAIVLPFSLWWEVRLWLPLSCVTVPLCLAGIQRVIKGPHETPATGGDADSV